MTHALAAAVFALAQAAPAASQAQELAGRVVHGVEEAGIEGARVELHRVTETGGGIVDSTTSGPDGAFRFRLPGDEGRPLFLAAARYEDVRYFGPPRHAGMDAAEPYEVLVYDTAAVGAPPEDLRAAIRQIVVAPGLEGGLDVAEIVDVVGPSDRTLVAADDSVALWSVPLPDGASAPRVVDGGVAAGSVEFTGGRAVLRSMISPVGVRMSYAYAIEGDELEITLAHPTDRLEVVVIGADAEVRGAAHAETSTRRGHLVHRYEAASLAAGETVAVALVTPGRVDRWVWIWAAIGAALLAAAALVALRGRAAAG